MNPVVTGVLRILAWMGISVGREGVSLGELTGLPRLQLRQGSLTIQTTHSRLNPGKEVYRIDVQPLGTGYALQAYQRRTGGGSRPNVFRCQEVLRRPRMGEDLRNVEFIWLDPDGTRHPLTIEGWSRGTDRGTPSRGQAEVMEH